MAVLIANANALFSGVATWAVANSVNDSLAFTTALTTAYVEGTAFTPGAVTIDGIAIKVAVRAAVPVGTISIRLAQGGVTVAGTELAINVSDLDSRDGEQGWYLFKFAPVLLIAATLYTVSAKTSNASMVSLYQSGGPNWTRMLRTTTAGTLAAGDNWHIMGEYTAPATKTDRTVTMDSTATTDYGDNTAANPPQFTINKGGTLTWGSTAATAYRLRLSGKLWIFQSGTMTMGTVLTPIPRDGSALLEFDCTADGDYGLAIYGTCTAQGLSRTAGKIFTICKLNGDEAAGQTTLSVDTDTGWLSGDEIALAPTTRTLTQSETRVLNGAAGATTLAVTAGLTNAHSGTSPTQAEMILLTRNVRIESVSTSFMAYVFFGGVCQADFDWVSFRYFGTNATGKRGVELSPVSTALVTLDYCSVRDFDRFGIFVTGVTTQNFYIRNCVGYKVGGQTGTDSGIAVFTVITSAAWEVSDCCIISNNGSGGYGLYFESLTGVVRRITGIACQTAGIGVNLAGGRIAGTCSDWIAHSNATAGIELSDIIGGRIDNLTAWRQNGSSQQGGITFATRIGELILHGVTLFGNATGNILPTNGATLVGPLLIRNGVFAGDTTFATSVGFAFPSALNGAWGLRMIFENCTFGVASGILVAHSTADIDFTANTPHYVQLVLRKVLLASTTEFANRTALTGRSYIGYEMQDQVAGDHITDYPAVGLIEYETSVFHTASPSEKLTPSGATAALRLRTQVRRFPVKSGQALAVSVWVRKSSLYTGSTVRLLAFSNAAIGISDDTVVDSMTAVADTWEQLTGTLPAATADGVIELVVECDGSAGIAYVDDWAAAVA
jgi:hypothetical protein